MIDSLTHIKAEDYDEYNRRKFRRRRKNQRFRKRRKPPVRYGNMGFPIKVKFPTKKHPKIVKAAPNKAVKLPPIKPMTIKNTGGIKPTRPTPFPKPIWTKRGGKAVKTKVGISQLMAKTNSTTQIKDKVISTNTKAVKQATTSEALPNDPKKNIGATSDSKVGKIVKVVTGITILGFTGYGIYRYIQYRKKKGTNLKK